MTKREEGTVAESTTTKEVDEGAGAAPEEEAEASVSEYTTETAPDAGRKAAARPVVTGKAIGTGRRKEAIARVRIAPGTGQHGSPGAESPGRRVRCGWGSRARSRWWIRRTAPR
jgi:hypothetical protein